MAPCDSKCCDYRHSASLWRSTVAGWAFSGEITKIIAMNGTNARYSTTGITFRTLSLVRSSRFPTEKDKERTNNRVPYYALDKRKIWQNASLAIGKNSGTVLNHVCRDNHSHVFRGQALGRYHFKFLKISEENAHKLFFSIDLFHFAISRQ